MGAPVSFRDLLPILVPRGADAGIVMLTAYFDDSGTHDDSDIVAMAGLFGNQFQWDAVDSAWEKRLKESVPGKLEIKRFHMDDCANGSGEFLGWSRLECDFLARELGAI